MNTSFAAVWFLKVLVMDPCCSLSVIPFNNQWQCEEMLDIVWGDLSAGDTLYHTKIGCIYIPLEKPEAP